MESQFLSEALVEGKYTPTIPELKTLLSKIDLKDKFKDTEIVKDGGSGISISFNSLEASHLFALLIYEKGPEMQLWTVGPADVFFEGKLFKENRFPDGILSFNETEKNGKYIGNVMTKFNEIWGEARTGREEKYTRLIHEIVNENIPHLAKTVESFSFK